MTTTTNIAGRTWLKKIMTVCLLASPLVAAQVDELTDLPQARVGFSPPRFELEWEGAGKTESLVVLNTSDKPLKIDVSVANWDLDEHSRTRVLPPTEQSLDQWMVVNPLSFEIEPHGQQTVRFAIRPRVAPSPGEHRAMLYLEEQPLDSGDAPESVQVNFRFGLPVYLQVGEAVRTGDLHNVQLMRTQQGAALGVDFSNTGSAYCRLDAHYAIWRESEYPGDAKARARIDRLAGVEDDRDIELLYFNRLPGTPVLPGDRRTLAMPLDLPQVPGSFVMAVSGSMGDVAVWKTLRFSRASQTP